MRHKRRVASQGLQKFAQNALEVMLADDESVDPIDLDHAVGMMVRIALYLPGHTRLRHLERILDLQYRGHILQELLVGIGRLATSLPKNRARDAWDAVLETQEWRVLFPFSRS
jgi:hypothetical protein